MIFVSGQFINFYSSVLGANMFRFYLLDVTDKIKYLLGKTQKGQKIAYLWMEISKSKIHSKSSELLKLPTFERVKSWKDF